MKLNLASEDTFEDPLPNRVSIEEMRKIWDDEHVKYTDQELYKMRNWFYVISNACLHVIEKYRDQWKLEDLKKIVNSAKAEKKQPEKQFSTKDV